MKQKLTKMVASATLVLAFAAPLLQALPAQAKDHDQDDRHDNGLHRGWYKQGSSGVAPGHLRVRSGINRSWRGRDTDRDVTGNRHRTRSGMATWSRNHGVSTWNRTHPLSGVHRFEIQRHHNRDNH